MRDKWNSVRGAARLTGVLAMGLALTGCVTTDAAKAPAWVTDPTGVDVLYPRASFLTGFGVSAASSVTDVMSRRQAESAALADIAALVQVTISDTIEDLDTSVERNGRLLTQSVRIQHTRRMVSGLLSGAEIKDVYYDPRGMNWHALAVLDRAGAGRGAAEAVAQRLRAGQAVLDGDPNGSLSRYLALRRLERGVPDLEQLAMAVAMFAPPLLGRTREMIEAYKSGLCDQLAATASAAVVRLAWTGIDDAHRLADPLAGVLRAAGLRVGGADARAVLTLAVDCRDALQVGSARIYRATSGARFTLTEGETVLLEGQVPADDATVSRAAERSTARRRSIERLGKALPGAVANALDTLMDASLEGF